MQEEFVIKTTINPLPGVTGGNLDIRFLIDKYRALPSVKTKNDHSDDDQEPGFFGDKDTTIRTPESGLKKKDYGPDFIVPACHFSFQMYKGWRVIHLELNAESCSSYPALFANVLTNAYTTPSVESYEYSRKHFYRENKAPLHECFSPAYVMSIPDLFSIQFQGITCQFYEKCQYNLDLNTFSAEHFRGAVIERLRILSRFVDGIRDYTPSTGTISAIDLFD